MLDAATQKSLAMDLFNKCWELIELSERTIEQDLQMLHLANASAWHWSQVGTDENNAVSEWQCSRVNALLGFGDAALLHAERSVSLIKDLPIPHFMHSSAAEGLAFAHYVAGNHDDALRYKAEALILLDGVEEDDAEHIRGQIKALPF